MHADTDITDTLPVVDSVRLGEAHISQETPGADPFLNQGDEIKALEGTTPVFKRRITNDLKKFHRGDGAESKKTEDETITGYNAFDVVAPPYNQQYLAQLYDISSPHHAAVDAKVANIVGLGFNFVETTATKRLLEDLAGNEKKTASARKKLDRHKEDLINKVDSWNDDDTFIETMVKVWRDYETTGNGYIEVGRKKDGTIGYIGHISAPTVRIRRSRDGFVQIISNRAVFFRNFGDKDTKNPFGGDKTPNEIIHLKNYSPTNGFYGIPDIISAKQAVAGNEFIARYNLDYFENKAIPRHAVILKGAKLGVAAETSLLQFLETGLKGKNHRTIYIPLPGDTPDTKVSLEFKAIESGVQEASFSNYNKSNRNEILTAHRVPSSKIGVAEGVSLAVARDADKTFKEQVCAPSQRTLEKKLAKVFKEITNAFELKFNEMTLTDEVTQSQIDERYVKIGVLTRNEIRARKGLSGIPGGDKIIRIEDKPEARAEARADGNRERDARRTAGATDTNGEGRNPKGEGRTVDA